jgi:hypothetical protein
MTFTCQMLTSPPTGKVCTKQESNPTGAMEVLTGFPLLDILIQ